LEEIAEQKKEKLEAGEDWEEPDEKEFPHGSYAPFKT